MTQYMVSKKFLTSASYPFPANRWGIPSALSLLGGGENASDYCSALSKSSTWGNNSFSAQNQLPLNDNRSVARSSEQTNSTAAAYQDMYNNMDSNKDSIGGESENFNRKPSENSWAHVAGKGLDSIPTNERVQFLHDVLLSPDGWSKDNVNQESAWELPPSPEPIVKSSAHSRMNVNNGCDLWQSAKETGNASGSWNEGSPTNKKQDDVQNRWLEFSPAWRSSVNELPDNNWTGQKVNASLDQVETHSPKVCLSSNLTTTATHSIPSISSPSKSCILPNSYSLGPFTHKESQLLYGQANAMPTTKDSGIGSTSPLISNVQLPSDCVPLNPKQPWDNVVSVNKDSSGYLGSHQVGPQWVAMPNHSIPDHHIMSSQAPLISPHLQHTYSAYKPDQIIWPQVPSQDYQSDFSSGWPNAMTSNATTSKQKGQSLQLDNPDDMNRDSAQPIPSLVSQIEFAVRAGYLSYNIYNEPLAPNTILLLNHLLSAINFLHKLLQQQTTLQPQAQINKNAQQQFLLVNGHINKVKQQIQYLQNQISSQQSMYLRQQPSQLHTQAVHNLPISNPPAMNVSTGMKNNLPDSLLLNFGQLGIGGNDVNGWKCSNVSGKVQQPNMLMMPPDRQQWNSRVKEPTWHVSPSSNCISPTVRVSNESSWPQQNVQHHNYDFKSIQSGKPWLVKNMIDYSGSSGVKTKPNCDLINLAKTKPTRVEDHVEGDVVSLGLGGSSTWSYKTDGQRNVSERKISQNAVRKDLPWSESRLNSDSWAASTNQTSLAKKTSCWESSWSDGTVAAANLTQWSNANSSTWLVLKNLTPEVDGSTLKTLCLQHGPLVSFHLVSNYGFALANYGNKEEAIKAQSNLNNCLLSNTTILAEFATQSEVNELLAGILPPATTTWTQATKTASTISTKAPTTPQSEGWVGSSSLWANGTTNALWSGGSDNRDGSDPVSELTAKAYLSKSMLNMEPI